MVLLKELPRGCQGIMCALAVAAAPAAVNGFGGWAGTMEALRDGVSFDRTAQAESQSLESPPELFTYLHKLNAVSVSHHRKILVTFNIKPTMCVV